VCDECQSYYIASPDKRARVSDWRNSSFARIVRGAGLELGGHHTNSLSELLANGSRLHISTGTEVSVFQRRLVLSLKSNSEVITDVIVS